MDITGAKLFVRVKTNVGVDVISKDSDPGNGITITDAPGGLADVVFTSSETAALSPDYVDKSLRLEVQIRSQTGKITTLKRASITILRDRLVA